MLFITYAQECDLVFKKCLAKKIVITRTARSSKSSCERLKMAYLMLESDSYSLRYDPLSRGRYFLITLW